MDVRGLQGLLESWGITEPSGPVSKADIDRHLYSQQNRMGLMSRAGISQDPLSQSYADYFASRYKDTPAGMYQPSVPLQGYMEAERLTYDRKAPEGDRLKQAINDKKSRVPGGLAVNLQSSGNSDLAGEYLAAEDQINLFSQPKNKDNFYYVLETLAHELEHRGDSQRGFEGDQYWSLNSNPREKVKLGHHRKWKDYEVEKPLYDLARSALMSGEEVHPSIIERFPDLKDIITLRKNLMRK